VSRPCRTFCGGGGGGRGKVGCAVEACGVTAAG